MANIRVEYHKVLNPKLWDGMEMKPEVRKKLLAAVNAFLDFCFLPVRPKDIILVGSQVNYTWTDESDIDINVIVDLHHFKDPKLIKEFFDTKKKLYKRDHDIRILDIPMEITVDEKNGSDASYSLLNGEWVDQPKYQKPEFDGDKASDLADKWKDRILTLVKDPDTKFKELVQLTRQIKGARADAVEDKDTTEFHPVNIAYKHIRKQGLIDRLKNTMRKRVVKQLSLKK